MLSGMKPMGQKPMYVTIYVKCTLEKCECEVLELYTKFFRRKVSSASATCIQVRHQGKEIKEEDYYICTAVQDFFLILLLCRSTSVKLLYALSL